MLFFIKKYRYSDIFSLFLILLIAILYYYANNLY